MGINLFGSSYYLQKSFTFILLGLSVNLALADTASFSEDSSEFNYRLGSDGDYFNDIDFADMNGDDLPDLVLVQVTPSKELFWVTNAGTASNPSFGAKNTPALATAAYNSGMCAGDIDNDGLVDIIWAGTPGNGEVRYYFLNEGTSSVPSYGSPGDITSIGLPGDEPLPLACDFADLTGDGKLDILINKKLYRNDTVSVGSPTFSKIADFTYDTSMSSFTFGDLDNDGDQDILGVNGGGGSSEPTLMYYENVGTSSSPSFSRNDSAHDLSGYTTPGFFGFIWDPRIELVDLDDDGDLDLVSGEYSGFLRFFRNTNTPSVVSSAPTVTTSTPIQEGIVNALAGGDVTSDGGASVTAKGVVWATSTSPTTSDNVVYMGDDTGSFNQLIYGLPTGQTIYIRAFATNSVGTSYGSEVTVSTDDTGATIIFPASDGVKKDYWGYNTQTGQVGRVAKIDNGSLFGDSGSGPFSQTYVLGNFTYGFFDTPNGVAFSKFDGSTFTVIDDSTTWNPNYCYGYLYWNNKIYFIGNDDQNTYLNGFDIYEYDPSDDSLTNITDTSGVTYDAYGAYDLEIYDDGSGQQLYFAARASNATANNTLYRYDGSTISAASGFSYSNVAEMEVFNGELYMSASPSGQTNDTRTVKYDGTTSSQVIETHTNTDTQSSDYPQDFIVFNNKLYFQSSTGTGSVNSNPENNLLYSVDTSGSVSVVYGNSGNPAGYPELNGSASAFVYNNNLYFKADVSQNSDSEIIQLTSGGSATSIVTTSNQRFIQGATFYDDGIFFFQERDTDLDDEPYFYNFNTTSLTNLADINPGGTPNGSSWASISNALSVFTGNLAPFIQVGTSSMIAGIGDTTSIGTDTTVYDVDTNAISSATVSIESGFQSGDVLAATDQHGITTSYNSGSGVLTLAITGSATSSEVQDVLQSVTIQSSLGGSKTILYQATDTDSLTNNTTVTDSARQTINIVDGTLVTLPFSSLPTGLNNSSGNFVGTFTVSDADLGNIVFKVTDDNTSTAFESLSLSFGATTYGLRYSETSEELEVEIDSGLASPVELVFKADNDFKLLSFAALDRSNSTFDRYVVTAYLNGSQVFQETIVGSSSVKTAYEPNSTNQDAIVDEVRINGSWASETVAGFSSFIDNINLLAVSSADSDGTLTASTTVTEPVGLDTTVDTVGEAVDVFDFTLSDGGTADGVAMDVSQIVVNVSGTTSDAVRSQVTWRLNGSDVSNVAGVYNAGADTITFSGLSISIADGTSETYTVNAYYNNNTGLTEDQTFILSVDGDTDLTLSGSGTQMASTSAVTNGSGSTVDVTATSLVFTTQPAGSTSGSILTTQPVVAARDSAGNTDVDFSEIVTLIEGSAGTLSGDVDITAVSGVATFTDVAYSASADQQNFTLTANDQDGVGSDLSTVDASSVTSDVVATKLVFDTQPAPLSLGSGIAESLTTVPVVSAQDDDNIVDTGYSTDITLSEVNGAGSATMTGTGDNDGNGATVSVTPSSGVSTFTSLQLTYTNNASGNETFNLRASSGGLSTADSSQMTSSTAPSITSSIYDAFAGTLVVTGTNFTSTGGVTNDVDASVLTLTGEGGETYILTDTADVEIDSSTQFTVVFSSTDKESVNQILNNDGTTSTGGTGYNLSAAAGFIVGNGSASDLSNSITVSNVSTPTIISAIYDVSAGSLVVTGTNLLKRSGVTNDIDLSLLTLTGDAGNTYTLTSNDVEITSNSSFSVTLNSSDLLAVNGLLNKDGTTSSDGTSYNLAAAEDWNRGANSSVTIADVSGNSITVNNVGTPILTSATYDASSGALVVTGTGFVSRVGASNDIDVSLLSLTGEGSNSYTLSSTDVEVSSATSFTINLSTTDRLNVNGILNANGLVSAGGTTYNLAASDNWMAAAADSVDIADASGNGVTVSNTTTPTITSAVYNASTGALVITGTNFVKFPGSANDLDVSTLSLLGDGNNSRTLTSTDVEINSASSVSLVLNAADQLAVGGLLNANGTTSGDGTTYNIAAADNWLPAVATATDISDVSGNAVTVSGVNAPTISSATYDASTQTLIVTGSNFVNENGAANDVDLSLLTITGDGGNTYSLTSTDVEVASATQFSVALNSADGINVNGLLNANGTESADTTTYNLAASDNWMPGANANTDISDASGNAITVSGVASPTITSATYDASTGILVVTGTSLVAATGANNDITVSTLIITGDGGNTYTLTSDSVEISSSTSFSITLNAADRLAVGGLLNADGTDSDDSTAYNIAASDNWQPAAAAIVDIADVSGNPITVSNVANPTLTSATYDASSGILVLTGTNFVNEAGFTNDVDVSRLTITGEGGNTRTISNTTDVEVASATSATITLNIVDVLHLNGLLNTNGTSADDGTTYNIAAADNWMPGAAASVNIEDLTSNAVIVSNVSTPTITSATYNASTGALVVTGTNFSKYPGLANDLDISAFTITGEGGSTRNLSAASDVEITSGSSFTVTLSGVEKTAVDALITKNGTTASDNTTYNLAAADDWMPGAAASTDIADLTGNSITASNVPDADGDLVASVLVSEPIGLSTAVTDSGSAVNVFDFTLVDGGTADGFALGVSQIVVNVGGTASDTQRNQVTWQLNGPDESNVVGTYDAATDTITFSGLSISVIDGGNETYTISAFFNDASSITEGLTFVLTVDGDTDVTVTSGGTLMGSTTELNNSDNGRDATFNVIATTLAFSTQPAGSVSGAALTTQPVVVAVDAAGNIDTDFTSTVNLSEISSGNLSNNSIAAVSGVASFTNLIYSASADQESFTLSASATGLSGASANSVTSDVVATLLAFSTQPAGSVSGQALTTQPVVTARDADGLTDTGFTQTVTLTEASDGALSNGSIAASAGVATFSGLTYTATADQESFTLSAASTGLTGATANAVTSDVVATQLAFTTQPAGSVSGVAFTTQPVVTAQDANGTTDTGFTETITLTENGNGSIIGASVAATAGVATFTALTYTATADQEDFTLTANDQDVVSTDLATVDANLVTSDVVATELAFSTQPAPLRVINGSATTMTTVPVVLARDGNGLTDTDYVTDIVLSEVNGAGSVAMTADSDSDASGATVTMAANAGSATYSGLQLTYTNNGSTDENFNLRASSGSLTAATSSQMTGVIPDNDGSISASGAVNEPVAISTVVDTSGEAVAIFDFTISDGGSADAAALMIDTLRINTSGTLDPSKLTFVLNGPDAVNAAGTYSSNVITFSGLNISVIDGGNETYTLSAYYNDNTGLSEGQTLILSLDGDTDIDASAFGTQFGSTTALTNSTGSTVSVTATNLAFTTQPEGSVSGVALTTQPVVTAQDAFGNTDTDFAQTVVVTELSAGTLSGNAATASAGVASFSNLTYRADADQESFTLTASATGMISATANSVTSDVVATELAFTTQPAGSVSGFALTTQPVVTARDADGLTDTDFTSTVVLTEASDGSLISVTATANAGVASFSDLIYMATADQQSFTLTANATGVTAANANPVTSDVVATRLTFTTEPAPSSLINGADTTMTTVPVVAAQNSNGVTDTDYTTAIVLAEVNGAGSATMSATGDTDGSANTVTLTPNAGVATYTGLQITYTNSGDTNENFNLQATSGSLTADTSSALLGRIPDSDGSIAAGVGVDEPVGIDTTLDTAGEAIAIFDFIIMDGSTADGTDLSVSDIRINTSGTLDASKLSYVLNGPDVVNAMGTYDSNVITFSGLSIAVADGGMETYTLSAYYNDNTGITEDQTLILSLDGDTDIDVSATGTQFASTDAIGNGTGSTADVVATELVVTTQPDGSVSGQALSTQPVITAQDAFGNTDVDFVLDVVLSEASDGSLTGNSLTAVAGIATFTDLIYIANADQEDFTLTASATGVTSVSANTVTSDVVATQLSFTTQPAGSVSGAALTTQPVVTAQDDDGTTDTDFTESVSLSEASDGSLTGGSATAVDGVASFTSVTYTATADQESFELTASYTGLTSDTADAVISDVVATQLVFSVQPSTLAVYNGVSTDLSSIEVQALDANGVLDSGYTSSITVGISNAAGAITINATGDGDVDPATITVDSSGGIASFDDVNIVYDNSVNVDETFNLEASSGGLTSVDSDQLTGVALPTIASATYDAATGVLSVTGSGFVALSGDSNDIDVGLLSITGEGGESHTLTTTDVEIDSASAFSVTLTDEDKLIVNGLLNTDGTSADDSTAYNLAAADDFNSAVIEADTEDSTNAITVSNVAAPAITSATYDGESGALVVTGTRFVRNVGDSNDVDASAFTITGESGETYTISSDSDVEITSETSFTITLSGADLDGVNDLVNKDGTASLDDTTYNLAAADNWLLGAAASADTSDASGNGITASNTNALPIMTSTATTDVTVVEDVTSNLDLSSIDVFDNNNDTLTVTLSITAGTFATPADGSAVGDGVVATLVDDTTVTLVGVHADITTYLDAASNIQYLSERDVFGDNQAQVRVSINDGQGSGDIDLASINIDITAVNDAPTLSTTIVDGIFTENGDSLGFFSNTSISTVEDGQALSGMVLTITNVNDGVNEVLTLDGTDILLVDGTTGTTAINSLNYSVSVDGSTVTVTLDGGSMTAAEAQTLVDSITYRNNSENPTSGNRAVTIRDLSDNGGGENTAMPGSATTLEVVSVNDAPVPAADTFNLNEGALLQRNAAQGVLANDVDVDGDVLTVTVVSNPRSATSFALSADGSFSYQHNGGEVRRDSFTYTVTDGTVVSEPTTVSMVVAPVNDPPTFSTQPPSTSVVQGRRFVYAVGVSDTDSVATVSLVEAPSWLTLRSGQLSGTAPYDVEGEANVVLRAADSQYTVDQSFAVNVLTRETPVVDIVTTWVGLPSIAGEQLTLRVQLNHVRGPAVLNGVLSVDLQGADFTSSLNACSAGTEVEYECAASLGVGESLIYNLKLTPNADGNTVVVLILNEQTTQNDLGETITDVSTTRRSVSEGNLTFNLAKATALGSIQLIDDNDKEMVAGTSLGETVKLLDYDLSTLIATQVGEIENRGETTQVKVGDLDLDSLQDIVVVNSNGDASQVYYQRGDLVFEIEEDTQPLAFANEAMLRDLNDDGYPELLLGASGFDLYIYVNQNGVYSEEPYVFNSPVSIVHFALLGRKPSDGPLEGNLAIASTDALLLVRFALGVESQSKVGDNPTPVALQKFELSQLPIPGVTAIRTADLDGDGNEELVVSTEHENNSAEKSGVTVVAVSNEGVMTEAAKLGNASAKNVEVADFNGDSVPDLMVANDNDSYQFYYGNGQADDFTLKDTIIYNESTLVLPEDVNDDGLSDVLIYENNEEEVEVFVSAPDGSVGASTDLLLTTAVTPSNKAQYQVSYTLTATNQGTTMANAVMTRFTVPTDITVAALPDTCTQTDDVVECALGNIAAESSASATVVLMGAANIGQKSLTAQVQSNGLELTPADNTAQSSLDGMFQPTRVRVRGGGGGGALDPSWLLLLPLLLLLGRRGRKGMVVAALMMVSVFSKAEEPHWYTELSVGQATSGYGENTFEDKFAAVAQEGTVLNFDDSRTSWALLAGYQLSTSFSVEGGYQDWGEVELEVDAIASDVNAVRDFMRREYPVSGEGYYIGTRWSHHDIDRVELFAKAGLLFWSGDYTIEVGDTSEKVDENGLDLVFAAGISTPLFNNTRGGLQVQHSRMDDQSQLQISLLLNYKFK